MSEHIDLERILRLLHDDRALFEQLCEEDLLPRGVEVFTVEHAETARVVGTLVHELEVNWAGAEVILRIRAELLATRRQVIELLHVLRERADDPER